MDSWLQELTPERLGSHLFSGLGSRMEAMVFLAKTFHSIPEGVAVGVGYAGERLDYASVSGFGVAMAIAIHNIPEGGSCDVPFQ
jgi:zinc transporter ZupT